MPYRSPDLKAGQNFMPTMRPRMVKMMGIVIVAPRLLISLKIDTITFIFLSP